MMETSKNYGYDKPLPFRQPRQTLHLLQLESQVHPNASVASVLSDKVVEMVPVEERGQLGENVFVIIHLPRVSAKNKNQIR